MSRIRISSHHFHCCHPGLKSVTSLLDYSNNLVTGLHNLSRFLMVCHWEHSQWFLWASLHVMSLLCPNQVFFFTLQLKVYINPCNGSQDPISSELVCFTPTWFSMTTVYFRALACLLLIKHARNITAPGHHLTCSLSLELRSWLPQGLQVLLRCTFPLGVSLTTLFETAPHAPRHHSAATSPKAQCSIPPSTHFCSANHFLLHNLNGITAYFSLSASPGTIWATRRKRVFNFFLFYSPMYSKGLRSFPAHNKSSVNIF